MTGAAHYGMLGRHRLMEKTRHRIVDVAIALYADRGVTRTSYSLVAKRAGVASLRTRI